MKIDGIVVVEGKSDVSFLSNFIEAEFVTTNGSEISKETIDYLKKASAFRKIYVLTDPDYPGERIRKILDDNINNLSHCFVRKEHSIKKGKVGVAESNKEEIELALKNAVTFDKKPENSITMYQLSELGLTGEGDSSLKRKQVCEKLHLGYCNAKTFLNRVNSCGLTIDEISKAL